ncbi:V-type proton ATPase 116 kDa subunit a 1-like [Oppia nitens]|uniref:V-type proton ATPase 116 kDa subunit a 1-like n=1 Tax=Oppia nitens TaxID=1686743 RepID=UPI0023DCA3A9|nr:V-type proton ATPase 116 kDa subunit a 1-like [Oppia nitens]
MGSLFRSEPMTLCQLFLQSEATYNCIAELGALGLVEFKDLNGQINAFQRRFVNEIRRCDEMERKLRFLDKEIRRELIPVLDIGDDPEPPQPKEMIELEQTFERLETELKDVNHNAEALKKTYSELVELRQILNKSDYFLDEAENRQRRESLGATDDTTRILPDDSHHPYSTGRLSFVAGVIRRDRQMTFERMLWRVCRGNVFLRQREIDKPLEDPTTGDLVFKSVFIIFFQGDQLKAKVKKICEGFRATIYPCPEDAADRRLMVSNVLSRIDDLNTVLSQTNEHRHRVLLASAKNLRNWFIKVRKMKAIFHSMNMFAFDVTQKCLIAECWCPTDRLDNVRMALRYGTERSGSSVPSILNRMETSEQPPTFNRTNKFTVGFQTIVDAYGVANYGEVNPAPYTIVTFPFLFAVMFGDAGHGVLMALFALWMVLKERQLAAQKSNNEIWLTFFNGRYLILLMGLFSIYTGFIYNDCFAKSMNIFGSQYVAPSPQDVAINKTDVPRFTTASYGLNSKINIKHDSLPYLLGIDPIWQVSENRIVFLNTYKMKVSVILGVMQMLFGVILSLWNHTYFKKYINIFVEFIPQVLFLLCIFGYMIGMTFAKWFLYDETNSNDAPSVLICLINMFLFKYDADDDPKAPKYLKQWYPNQKLIQTILLVIALICVPWMLAIKPWYLNRVDKKKQALIRRHSDGNDTSVLVVVEDSNDSGGGGHDGHGGGPFDLGDTIINQAIHTIEYCLGSISHTASYLRLWALSLAHSQLSDVLWNMVMKIGLTGLEGMPYFVNGIVMFLIFAIWAGLTVSVLLVMEGLSAFLHALRLHWVEFQSKFYSGAGIMFQPFSFEVILDVAEKEAEAAISAASANS